MKRLTFATILLSGALAVSCGESSSELIEYSDLLFHADRFRDTKVSIADDLGVLSVGATEHGPRVNVTDYTCISSPYTGNDPATEESFNDYCYTERNLAVLFFGDISGTIREMDKVRLEGVVRLEDDWALMDAKLLSGETTLASGGIALLPSPLR